MLNREGVNLFVPIPLFGSELKFKTQNKNWGGVLATTVLTDTLGPFNLLVRALLIFVDKFE
ncbi:hypothetical protein DSQ19_03045 [Candidatus Nitrosotenuis sp. DW1]|nr:hypothetical protein DSQ19_03045 [Candidatus Nitrosotenuis sp. DW1]